MAGTSRMNPQSIPSVPSALAQAMVRWERKETLSRNGASEPRESGRRGSQGLKVKKSTGLRTSDRRATGATRLKTATAAATPKTTPVRERSAAMIPRRVCAIAVRTVLIEDVRICDMTRDDHGKRQVQAPAAPPPRTAPPDRIVRNTFPQREKIRFRRVGTGTCRVHS